MEIGFEFLEFGEVWKVGQTRKGEKGRYSGDTFYNITSLNLKLTTEELVYEKIQEGSYKEMLILEKILIYTYPAWSGHPTLLKPPGCRIYR